MDDFQQFRETYLSECFELLEEMETKLLELDAENADKEELNAIFRCAHSIKGGAGAFGFEKIAAFTHILEALLDRIREDEIAITPDAVDTLLRARDVVYQMVLAAQSGEALASDYGQDVIKELESYNPDGPTVADASSDTPGDATVSGNQDPVTYQIHFAPHREMIAHGNEPLLLMRELASLGEVEITCHTDKLPAFDQLDYESCYLHWDITLTGAVTETTIREVFEFVEDECDLQIEVASSAHEAPEVQASDAAPQIREPEEKASAKEGSAKAAPVASSIRVDIDKVDALINMVGEVVIAQAFLSSQVGHLPPQEHAELVRGVDDMMHHIRELQEAVMAVRMQPVKSIFSRMPRLVRDLSAQLGKDIAMEMHGEQTEVDKTIIEQLSDPLTHMIRNSVDHGIELPDKRQAHGKPRQGTIHLSAEHRGGRIVIEISDDGGGINREKVKAKAAEKGVISPDAHLSDGEIDMLIFAPGFSTADQVSDVSGRGVGMDVVKRNIESLGGMVQVENRPGKGSTFGISLPLTLAILDGMIIRCGEEYYIIPINNIIETLRPAKADVRPVADGHHVINMRGDFLPMVYLHQVLRIRDAKTEPSEALVIIVESGTQHFGIMVDELIGQQQVVIKTLEENADPVEGIAGATILGDGKVSLILDVARIHQMGLSTPPPRPKMKQEKKPEENYTDCIANETKAA